MDRKQELLSLIKDADQNMMIEAEKLIDEVCFLEGQLVELKKYPFICVNPAMPQIQKATPAARQYKELLQQYNNTMKLLLHIVGDLGADRDDGGESPLRQWARARKESKS